MCGNSSSDLTYHYCADFLLKKWISRSRQHQRGQGSISKLKLLLFKVDLCDMILKYGFESMLGRIKELEIT